MVIVSSTTSQVTIKALRKIYATHGIPEIIVSDNGTAFTSAEFKCFTKRNGIRHVTSSPYHPATNGLAERAVQTFKQALKKCSTSDVHGDFYGSIFVPLSYITSVADLEGVP